MLRAISTLKGLTVQALDGEIGSVYDVYFDAKQWTVRYFVVDTGHVAVRAPGPGVAHGLPDHPPTWSAIGCSVGLSKAQIEQAPSWDVDKPVSRQHEVAYARHYDYPYYWTGPARWGVAWDPLTGMAPVPRPGPGGGGGPRAGARERRRPSSTAPVTSSATTCRPRTMTWATWRTSWSTTTPGRSATSWSTRGTGCPAARSSSRPAGSRPVSWDDSRVYVDLLRKEVETAPEYDPNAPLERAIETRLYEHYRRPTYWDEEQRPALSPFTGETRRETRSRDVAARHPCSSHDSGGAQVSIRARCEVPASAAAQSDYEGQTFYFCSIDCKAEVRRESAAVRRRDRPGARRRAHRAEQVKQR